eukprot:scaffold219301_cov72-Attheya_sp.AAC.2
MIGSCPITYVYHYGSGDGGAGYIDTLRETVNVGMNCEARNAGPTTVHHDVLVLVYDKPILRNIELAARRSTKKTSSTLVSPAYTIQTPGPTSNSNY